MIVKIAEGYLKTKFGTFLEKLYYDGQKESIALIMGDVKDKKDILCRVHSACLSAHVFNSVECDCREQMEMSQFLIQQNGAGIIIWLDQEGRANGHMALLNSAPLREQGLTQSEAYEKLGYETDARNFKRASEILNDLGVESITLLTNNPQKIEGLINVGINISGIKQIFVEPDNEILQKTYMDKISRGHLIRVELDKA